MEKLALLFGMSENERKGFLVLSILIGLFGITPFIYSFYSRNTTDDILQISTIVEEGKPDERKDKVSHTIAGKSEAKEDETVMPFSFDPNNLPVEKWKALGFTEKQIQVIKNYESKGGRFNTKGDVAKMYVISDEDFERLEPYIALPKVAPIQPRNMTFIKKGAIEPSKRKILVDLSLADTTAFKQIYGIGSVLASRIVKFRDALGGFHTIEQLKEVYGISEEQFVKMESYLILGDNPIKKWAINDLSIEKLAQHPYISRRDATHIVRYREQHGAFTSFADVERMYALNDDFLRKIAPYLDFD